MAWCWLWTKITINAFDGKLIIVNKHLWHLAVADIYVLNENKCNVEYIFKLVGIWCRSCNSFYLTTFLSDRGSCCILNDIILCLPTLLAWCWMFITWDCFFLLSVSLNIWTVKQSFQNVLRKWVKNIYIKGYSQIRSFALLIHKYSTGLWDFWTLYVSIPWVDDCYWIIWC